MRTRGRRRKINWGGRQTTLEVRDNVPDRKKTGWLAGKRSDRTLKGGTKNERKRGGSEWGLKKRKRNANVWGTGAPVQKPIAKTCFHDLCKEKRVVTGGKALDRYKVVLQGGLRREP